MFIRKSTILRVPKVCVVRALYELTELRGKPQRIRLDNGPELASQSPAQLAKENGLELMFTRLGKPTQNAYIERFNRCYVWRYWIVMCSSHCMMSGS